MVGKENLRIEEIVDIKPPSRGIYRQTIINFLNSKIKKGKIELTFPVRAKHTARRLRGWISKGEPIKVIQDKNIIYLIRTDGEKI